MNYEEEQKNELEALQEIYYNEIEVLSNKAPYSLKIKVKSQTSCLEDSFNRLDEDDTNEDCDDNEDYDDSEDEGEETFDESQSGRPPILSITLKFDLPPKYPNEKPSIEIANSQNLDDYDLKDLLSNLQDKADESLGEVMIFTLINEASEWIVTKSTKMETEIQEGKDRKAKAEEAKLEKRFEGTKVTVQSFLTWKAKFDAEILKAKLEKAKLQGSDESGPTTGTGGQKRFTGRELFENDKSLVESDLNFDDLDQSQIESLLQIDDNGDDFDPSQFEDSHQDDSDYDDEDSDDDNEDDGDEGDSKKKSSKK